MSSNPLGLLRAALRAAPPDPDSDAELLGRYVAARDEAAFADLVRRHGPMVLAVCRRRLGPGPDAEDAFQATFLVLARDAGRIGSREALPGWLYRVAYLVALKLAGRNARRAAEALAEEPAVRSDPADHAADRELRDALDREVSALPDKLRSAVVLCCLEERTSAEAARLLGCPVGTVDSRLSAARQRLKARLARRGWPAAALAGLELFRAPPADASALFERTVRAALAYAAGRAAADPITSLANGVSPMGSAKLKLLLAAGMSLAVLGTAGFGLYHADGQEKSKRKPPTVEKGEPPKKPDTAAKSEPPAAKPDAGVSVPADEAGLRAVLTRPAGMEVDGISLRDFLDMLYAKHGVIARIDMAAYARAGGQPDFHPYEARIHLPLSRGMTVADMLTDVLAQLGGVDTGGGHGFTFTYRVRDNQVLIVPAYVPPVVPGSGSIPGGNQPQVDERRMIEQIVGEPVSVAVEDKPLTDAIKELHKLTGANIVVDARCKEKAKQPVSGSFSDVRLLTALTVLADMCDLKPVAMNNVYYVTTPENAAKLQKEINRDLFGEPHPPGMGGALPPGLFGGLGALGGPGTGGTAPPPQPAPPEKK